MPNKLIRAKESAFCELGFIRRARNRMYESAFDSNCFQITACRRQLASEIRRKSDQTSAGTVFIVIAP